MWGNTAKIPQFYIGKSAPPRQIDKVRIVCVGDTLGTNIFVPNGDIYIHTGNYTGDVGNICYFIQYLDALPHLYKVILSGEHELMNARDIISAGNIVGLDGATTLLHSLRICAATYIGRDGVVFKPFDCINDIIVSHIAPAGILDMNEFGEHTGSIDFLENLELFPPKVCIFGGIATGHGAVMYKNILCINAGIFYYDRIDEKLIQYGVPLVIDMPI